MKIFQDLPAKLPLADFQINTLDKFRYMSNVCTFGYTYAFWNWAKWEAHIDWMALSGINLPLAFTGQEVIWKRIWKMVNRFRAYPKELNFIGKNQCKLP